MGKTPLWWWGQALFLPRTFDFYLCLKIAGGQAPPWDAQGGKRTTAPPVYSTDINIYVSEELYYIWTYAVEVQWFSISKLYTCRVDKELDQTGYNHQFLNRFRPFVNKAPYSDFFLQNCSAYFFCFVIWIDRCQRSLLII